MLFAFGRLLFIFLCTLICLFLVVFALRSIGQRQLYSPLNHPLINHLPVIVVMGGYSHPKKVMPFSSAAYANTAKNNNVWMGLIVRTSMDGEWFVFPHRSLSPLTDDTAYFSQRTANEIARLRYRADSNGKNSMTASTHGIAALKNVLEQNKAGSFYIRIDQPKVDKGIEDLFQLIQSSGLLQKVIVSSPFADTTKALREKSNEWLVGASTSEVATLKMLAALFLEPLATTEYEVIEIENISPHSADQRMLDELNRRHRVVLFKTKDAEAYRRLAEKKRVSGVITDRPNLF